MERLTERNKNGLAMAACCAEACEYNYVCEVGGVGECRGMDDIIDRLAAIEDILGDEYDLDELREMVQAKREGRCVVLPTKTVFELVWCAGEGCNLVCPVSIDGKGCCDFCDYGALVIEEVPCRQEHIERIGADVFLTRAEAEAALRREQDGNRI